MLILFEDDRYMYFILEQNAKTTVEDTYLNTDYLAYKIRMIQIARTIDQRNGRWFCLLTKESQGTK